MADPAPAAPAAAPNNGTVTSLTPSTPAVPVTTSTPISSLISSITTETPTSTPTPTTSLSIPSSTSLVPTPSTTPNVLTSVVIAPGATSDQTQQVTTIFSTSTRNVAQTTGSSGTPTGAAASATSTGAALATSNEQASATGLPTGGVIAIAVVIPIVAVVLLILAGLWLWRKRKQRKEAEELRRKEMEEYGYNPNNDPTLPAVGGGSANGDEASTMRERDAGYRGWGTTTAQRKPSTTMSSHPGVARSDSGGNGGYGSQPSPTNAGPQSDGQSGDPLVSPITDESVGALGAAPVAGANRQNGVNRGPSNASSAYSGANRSDVSSEGPLPSGSPPFRDNYMYQEEGAANGNGNANGIGQAYSGDWDGQPVIREVSARRNTRIENPSIVPQQGNAGIAQNF